MKPDEVTTEQKDEIHAKLMELSGLIENILGGRAQLVMVCHPYHDPSGECNGVWVMDNENMGLRALAGLLTNAMILTEGAAVAEYMQTMRPPGEPLN